MCVFIYIYIYIYVWVCVCVCVCGVCVCRVCVVWCVCVCVGCVVCGVCVCVCVCVVYFLQWANFSLNRSNGMACVMLVLYIVFGLGTELWALRSLFNTYVSPDHKN